MGHSTQVYSGWFQETGMHHKRRETQKDKKALATEQVDRVHNYDLKRTNLILVVVAFFLLTRPGNI